MSDPLLIQKLNTQLGYLSQRQAVLAQNVANVDTPGYQAQDLKKLNFNDMAAAESHKLSLAETSPKHIASKLATGQFAEDKQRVVVESKPGGNNVVLEEQLGKVSDTGAQYQLSTSLLHKYNQLYATALDNHGS